MEGSPIDDLSRWWENVEGFLELKGKPDWRPLGRDEIAELVALGNRCESWSHLWVNETFQPKAYRNCEFLGQCYLSKSADGKIDGVRLKEVVLGEDITIQNTRELSYLIVGNGCRIIGCGSLGGGKENPWTPFLEIAMGSEMGHRSVWIQPCSSFEDVTRWVLEGKSNQESLELKQKSGLPEAISMSLMMANCDIEGLVRGEGFCLGPSTVIRDSSFLKNVVSVSSLEEKVRLGTGVILRECQLHDGASVLDYAHLERVVVGEQSRLEHKISVEESYIGPDNKLGKGEIVASLLGPMVGLHHQSLLIGSLWPEGRGNVGYGANVGSNHTGRKPDQEFFPGEGCFLGLDTSIKFPSNFSRSPYSLIATGVKANPQKIEFPFSLMMPGNSLRSNDLRDMNEIRPGWVYLHNPYFLHRNEMKFARRRKAKGVKWDHRPLRPKWIPLVYNALRALDKLGEKEFFLKADCPSLGDNVLTRSGLKEGHKAYLELLLHLMRLGVLEGHPISMKIIDFAKTNGWEEDEEACRHGLKEDLARILSSTKRSLGRDTLRGEQIMPDYRNAHPDPEDDMVVLDLESRLKDL